MNVVVRRTAIAACLAVAVGACAEAEGVGPTETNPPQDITFPPSAPVALGASASSSSSIDLQWSDVLGPRTFSVDRCRAPVVGEGCTPWERISTGLDGTSFSDGGLAASAEYCYRIQSSNSGGTSPFSPRSCAVTEALEPTGSNADIVYSSGGQLYTIKADGTNRSPLPTGGGERPRWSPDGLRIAFERDGDIYTSDASGFGVARLTRRGSEHAPSWSADGSRIAFHSIRGVTNSIVVMDANGSGLSIVSAGLFGEGERFPAWAPNGIRIAFSSQREGSDDQIYVVRVDGADAQRLASSSDDESPRFSPDGSRILFDSERGGAGRDLYLMDADGSNMVRLTANPGNDDQAAWAPDGQSIVFRSDRTGSSELWVIGADGTGLRQLTSEGGEAPDWRALN